MRTSIWLAILALVVLVVASLVVWAVAYEACPGRFSEANYGRITPGMAISECEVLLGGAGEEKPTADVPTVPPHQKLPGAPNGWLGVVWGDRCHIWRSDGRVIYVGVRDGKVTSKFYWEPSL